MANEQNLKPRVGGLTNEEQKKGGKKSAEVRSLRATVRKQLDQKVPKKGMSDIHELMNEMGFPKGSRTYNEAITAAILHKAVKGNIAAAQYIRDTVGEKPTDKTQVELGPDTRSNLTGLSLDEKKAMLDEMLNRLGGSD